MGNDDYNPGTMPKEGAGRVPEKGSNPAKYKKMVIESKQLSKKLSNLGKYQKSDRIWASTKEEFG